MSTQIPDLVDETKACKLIGGEDSPIHRSTLWRLVREGRLPKPINVTPHAVRWRVKDIAEHLENAPAVRAFHTLPPGVVAAAKLKRGKPTVNPDGRRGKKPAAKRKGR